MVTCCSWEECKVLLMFHKFRDSLKFFDRDHLSRDKLSRLEKMVGDIQPKKVLQTGSHAVISISQWLTALVKYHSVMRIMKPVRRQSMAAESSLNQVKRYYFGMISVL